MRLEGEAGELHAERRGLGVDAVRPAHGERARVLARPRRERRHELPGAGDQDLAARAQLQRERGVEHVGGGQPEVDPAPRLAHGRREHVDERGDVVLGDALALFAPPRR